MDAAAGWIVLTWSPEARSDLRAVHRDLAMQIFQGFRLRCRDYRVFFDLTGHNAIAITAVRDRNEAYR